MKHRYFFQAAIALLVIVLILSIAKNQKHHSHNDAGFYPLKERSGAMAQSDETKQVKKQFGDLMKIVRTNEDDTKSRIALATLYIQEARVTGQHGYYEKAALKYLEEVLAKEPKHFEALTFKALVNLSQHHFAEGLAIAEKARANNPDNAFVHGLLVDANVELGNYARAIDEAEKMISLRPDIRSYSRISYLREIHGDYPGAIEAMKLAVDAGMPGDEATEWARVQLGKLYETTADVKNAEMHYEIALQKRPGYAYAIVGQGRIAMANKNYTKAIQYFEQADALIDDHSIKEAMADAYELNGQKDKADAIIQSLIKEMSHEANHENSHHHIGLELANVYLKAGDYDEALHHAIAEYNRRPSNIDMNEMAAWIYYNKKEYEKALPYIEAAMKTNSKNPVLLSRAALIFAKTGDTAKAKSLL